MTAQDLEMWYCDYDLRMKLVDGPPRVHLSLESGVYPGWRGNRCNILTLALACEMCGKSPCSCERIGGLLK